MLYVNRWKFMQGEGKQLFLLSNEEPLLKMLDPACILYIVSTPTF